eukprot:339492-Rhodomonas_salina.1
MQPPSVSVGMGLVRTESFSSQPSSNDSTGSFVRRDDGKSAFLPLSALNQNDNLPVQFRDGAEKRTPEKPPHISALLQSPSSQSMASLMMKGHEKEVLDVA